MFQKTRFRLALWYTAITAILLLLFATGVYLYVRSTLIERIDDTLEHVVEIMENNLVREGIRTSPPVYHVNKAAGFPTTAASLEDDRIDMEWFNRDRELVWSTFEDPLVIPLSTNSHGKTVKVTSNYQLRQITAPIFLHNEVLGYLRVSHPWFEVTKPSRQLLGDLSLGIILMVTCVASIGWFLSGIAMKPVTESYQSLKQFTADASHELRNPLAMIQANVQMALSEPTIAGKLNLDRQQIEVIERLTKRLGRLVDDLLFLARSDGKVLQITPHQVSLDALLIEVIEEQTLSAKAKDITINLEIAEVEDWDKDPFAILGDWDQLARLFTNLVSNGIKYSYQQSTITITLSKYKSKGRHQLQVQVKDQGCGMTENSLNHIFERFYQVDSSRSNQAGELREQENKEENVKRNTIYPLMSKDPQEVEVTSKGSGLGLAIAKVIVDNHQGQIKVESKLNHGTIFTVILPMTN